MSGDLTFKFDALGYHCTNKLFNSIVVQDAAANVHAIHTLAELSDLELRNHALVLEVIFVANDDYVFDWELTVEVVLIDPLVQMVEALSICYVEDEDATVCTSIVASRQGSKSFLSSCIPKL